MLISTKGRYALCVLTDMAENNGNEKLISLKEISERQDISRKYLESIMTILTKNNMVESHHGKTGGYRLLRRPEEYSLYEVLLITEDSLAPVPCLEKGAEECAKACSCCTLDTWKQLNDMITSFFGNKTVADLMRK